MARLWELVLKSQIHCLVTGGSFVEVLEWPKHFLVVCTLWVDVPIVKIQLANFYGFNHICYKALPILIEHHEVIQCIHHRGMHDKRSRVCKSHSSKFFMAWSFEFLFACIFKTRTPYAPKTPLAGCNMLIHWVLTMLIPPPLLLSPRCRPLLPTLRNAYDYGSSTHKEIEEYLLFSTQW